MDQPILYNNPIISLSNKELQTRLRKMLFVSIPDNRDDLITMYTNALQNSSKKQLIQTELDQDNQIKNSHLKRQNIISYFEQANIPNDKAYKMDPCQICNNNNNNIIYFEKISLRRKKKKREILPVNNNTDNKNNNHNIHVITPQKEKENNFMTTPEKQENMLRDRLNIYDMINNKNKQNILSDEPTPMNFFIEKHNDDDKQIKRNTNLNNNCVINNINAKRNSLSQHKNQQPLKTRRTISNPKELTPISERNSFFENMSSRIGNSTNITSNNTSNISNFKFSSPSQLHFNNSSSSETPKSFSLQDNSIEKHNLHFSSQKCYNILLISFPVVSCGVLFYLYIKDRQNINNTISLSLGNLHTTIKRFLTDIIGECATKLKVVWKEIANNYLGYVVCLGILCVALWLLYRKYKEIKTLKEIFEDIKMELKEMMMYRNDDIIENNSVIGCGMSEREIIEKYSKKYKIKEEVFVKKYFPQLKQKRKKDITLKEFEEIINGTPQRIWQFTD